MWNEEDGMHLSEIGDLVRGDKSTRTRLLVPRVDRTKKWVATTVEGGCY